MTKKIQEGASFNMNADNAQEMGAMLKTIMQLSGLKPVDNSMMPKTDLPTATMVDPSMAIKSKNDELGDIVKNAGLPAVTTLPVIDEPEEEGMSGAMTGGAVGAMAGGPLGALQGAAAGSSLQNTIDDDEENEAYANEPEPCTKDYDPNANAGGLNGPKRHDYDVTPLGNNPMSKMAQHKESIETIKSRLIKEYKEFMTEWDPSMYRSGDENDPRSPDYSGYDGQWYGHGEKNIEEIDLPSPYDYQDKDPDFNVRQGEEITFYVNATADGEEFEINHIWGFGPDGDVEVDMNRAGRDWVNHVYEVVGPHLEQDYAPEEPDYDGPDY